MGSYAGEDEVATIARTTDTPKPASAPVTRIAECKHLTGQQHAGTSIVREYPHAEGDPYYPVPRAENEALFRRYEALAKADRDQVVGAALVAAKRFLGKGGDA